VSERGKKRKVNVTALSIADAAKVLNVDAAKIRTDIEAGLPLAGGKVNLVVCAAWLNAEGTAGR